MIDTLLAFLAPHLCISCGQIGAPLCTNCKYDIVMNTYQTCVLCGISSAQCSPTLCDGSWCIGYRKGVVQRLVGSFKFNGMRAAVRPLVDLLNTAAPPLPNDAIVTWIPTHPKHIRARGYDHMKVLAVAFSKKRRLNARPVLSRRTYFVQHKSSRKERLQQISGAFETTPVFEAGRTYVLLDDVYTTGATVNEAIRVLKAAGATQVIVGIIARQPLD